jgi:hypothetical protein
MVESGSPGADRGGQCWAPSTFGHTRLPAGDRGDHRTGRSAPPRSPGDFQADGLTPRRWQAQGQGAGRRRHRARPTSRARKAGRVRTAVGAAKAKACRRRWSAEGPDGVDAASSARAFKELRSRRASATTSSTPAAASTAATPTTVRPIVAGSRRAAARPRLGAVHPRRDPGAGASPRSAPAEDEQIIDALEGDLPRELHAALQLPALLGRRNGPHGLAGPPRDRPRQAGLARHPPDAAGQDEASPTRSASSRRSPSRTAPPRWPPSAAPRCR